MIIGLTGGIAAGKSTVRQLFAPRANMLVFDADAAVRRMLDGDPQTISAIGHAFGQEFIGMDGKPDRARLRETIYADPHARHRLEGILHPLVRAEWLALREECLATGVDMLADIPLIYETGAEGLFDIALVVGCSRDTQADRLRARGIGPKMAEAMLASQWPIGQKVQRADFVIWNDGSLAALGRQTELLLNQLFPA